MLEERRADDILVAAGAYGIEAERREDIPCRSLAVVLVTAVAVGGGTVEAGHDVAQMSLALPGLSAPVVEVDHVLYGLVAVGIVAGVHHRHFHNFVNGESIV